MLPRKGAVLKSPLSTFLLILWLDVFLRILPKDCKLCQIVISSCLLLYQSCESLKKCYDLFQGAEVGLTVVQSRAPADNSSIA